MSKKRLLFSLLVLSTGLLIADTGKFRVVWQENPESEATIIWDQISGDSPVLHYGKLDHGLDFSSYEFSSSPSSSITYRGMNNQFVKLSGLEPDTNYYLVVKDSNNISDRMYFRTAPNTKKPFKFIQGGDSRNNRAIRQDANLAVSKLRPLFVSFGGDMISTGSDEEWQNWFDDWQLTITDDGRMIPIVPVRGNHEDAGEVSTLFGLNNSNSYYKISISNDLFCQYLLNTQIDTDGAQKSWLENDLQENYSKYTFLSASYHKPMRPHVSNKPEGSYVYDSWAQLFYDYRFDILAENDSHCVKRTVPVKPSTEAGSDEGFIADSEGYIKIGEGCWGAPLRTADDPKNWTLDLGTFNSFDLLHVYTDKVEVRTIKVDNAANFGSLTELDDVFALPANIDIWQASGGAVQTVTPKNRTSAPAIETVFNYGSNWAYYDGVNAPAADWNTVSFNDSGWSNGNGQLGYGDGDETTILDFGGISSDKTPTYYFRKSFNIADVNTVAKLDMSLLYDDGAIVYLNGVEVQRINMTSETVDHTTYAASVAKDNSTTTFLLPLSYIANGENVLAIEVHNQSASSSDISFDAALVSTLQEVPDEEITSPVALVSDIDRIAWFPFDTDTNDADGNLSLTVYSTDIQSDSIYGSGALSADGPGEYVGINDSNLFNTSGVWPERTVSVYFKLNAISGRQVIFEEGGTSRGLNIYSENGILYVGGWDKKKDGNDVDIWAGTWLNIGSISANQWYHVALVLDTSADPVHLNPNGFKAYLNGTLAAAGDGMQIYAHKDDGALGGIVGSSLFHDGTTSGQSDFQGSLDDLAIWNRALNPEEIEILGSSEPEPPTPVDSIKLHHEVLNSVDTNWQTVTLPNTYNSMVVVATPVYDGSSAPAVVRIRNASENSFEIKLQNPGDGSSLTAKQVQIVVVEEGVYNEAEHGINMEAVKYTSTATSYKRYFAGEAQAYSNSYTAPVVIGQVMTYNDTSWSVFYCYGNGRSNPPDSTNLYTGKAVWQDSNKVRNDETIGYIVIESGSTDLNGSRILAGTGSDTIIGFDDGSSSYSLSGISSIDTVVTSMQAVDGTDGGWSVLNESPATTILNLNIDEDQIADIERAHTNEQVGYIIIGTP